jgi:hypothetical protein
MAHLNLDGSARVCAAAMLRCLFHKLFSMHNNQSLVAYLIA